MTYIILLKNSIKSNYTRLTFEWKSEVTEFLAGLVNQKMNKIYLQILIMETSS